MAKRISILVVAFWLAGCATGAGPVDSPGPAEATSAPSAVASPSPAASRPEGCVPESEGEVLASQIVAGTANIFGAGHDIPPAPGGGGGGTVPPAWELPGGSTTVTFPCVTGEVTPNTGQPLLNGPAGDREGAGGRNTDVTSHGGISGIVNLGNGMFLVGVFLTDDEPSEPAPPRLDFTDDEAFEELAPQIAQTFLVGDGRGRSYRVPSGATRLFVGFADAFLYEGPPGWYGNNAGDLEVTVAIGAG